MEGSIRLVESSETDLFMFDVKGEVSDNVGRENIGVVD
jgi:hypothetical protein